MTQRPQGNNADEWAAFLEEYCTGNLSYVAVQIAEALDSAIAAERKSAEGQRWLDDAGSDIIASPIPPAKEPAQGDRLDEAAALVRGVTYADHYRAWPTVEVSNARNGDAITWHCDRLADAFASLRAKPDAGAFAEGVEAAAKLVVTLDIAHAGNSMSRYEVARALRTLAPSTSTATEGKS